MDKQSKFLPDSVSGALKNLLMRALGGVLMVLGLWAVFALMFHNPYLDGFAAASTFGHQPIMGQVAGFVRYAIGFVPALFLFLCIARLGYVRLAAWTSDAAPEYNFLRGFIAVCMGAIGFGLILPRSTFGGLAGSIAAGDLTGLIGGWALIVGVFAIGLFVLLGARVLHIKWSHVRASAAAMWRTVRWVLSVFRLTTPPAVPQYLNPAEEFEVEEDTEEDESEEDDESDVVATPRRRAKAAARSARKVAASSGAGRNVRARCDEGYSLPPPELLAASNFSKIGVTTELKRTATSLEDHFEKFGVYGRVAGIKPGPIVTLFEFQPEDGMRNADIMKTTADMTRVMSAEKIRIAQMPGTPYLGIEVVNIKPQTVCYREIISDPLFVESKYKIPLALGVNIGGKPMYYDLAKMPHMLVAGRTGSGKSVFIQSLITSVVYHFTPDKCKLMIIDPKGVDFGFWDDIPHLITPIVKLDPVAAVNALKWAVREMEERYKQMGALDARNIESYNAAAAAKRAAGEKLTRQVAVGTDEETGELLFETQEIELPELPYIVIVIDEVADLMQLARKEVEGCIQRIAQKARAAGIHLIMATQRPDATTITGVIKANFPTRVSFQARSAIDSRTTLGEGGAENLLACGDMLFSEGGKAAVRIHGAFIDDPELRAIGDFLRAQGVPEYADGVTDGEDEEAAAPAAPSAAQVKADKNADLYEQAKEIVIRDKKPTISYLQRRLQIGYNKAAGFIERMEQEGVVSAPDINNKRQIL